jgi:ABC-type transporter Mla MlaB component
MLDRRSSPAIDAMESKAGMSVDWCDHWIDRDGAFVVEGDIDLATGPKLWAAIRTWCSTNVGRTANATIDLTHVGFMDSTGLELRA